MNKRAYYIGYMEKSARQLQAGDAANPYTAQSPAQPPLEAGRKGLDMVQRQNTADILAGPGGNPGAGVGQTLSHLPGVFSDWMSGAKKAAGGAVDSYLYGKGGTAGPSKNPLAHVKDLEGGSVKAGLRGGQGM